MIAVGSDHGGLALKNAVKSALIARGLEVDDYGPDNGDSVDYPDFAEKVAVAVSRGEVELGPAVALPAPQKRPAAQVVAANPGEG